MILFIVVLVLAGMIVALRWVRPVCTRCYQSRARIAMHYWNGKRYLECRDCSHIWPANWD